MVYCNLSSFIRGKCHWKLSRNYHFHLYCKPTAQLFRHLRKTHFNWQQLALTIYYKSSNMARQWQPKRTSYVALMKQQFVNPLSKENERNNSSGMVGARSKNTRVTAHARTRENTPERGRTCESVYAFLVWPISKFYNHLVRSSLGKVSGWS